MTAIIITGIICGTMFLYGIITKIFSYKTFSKIMNQSGLSQKEKAEIIHKISKGK